jgi:non-heme chloroperoxidase
MMGGAKAHYDCIKAFSETDFTEDVEAHRRSDARDARQRRPDRAVCGCAPGTLSVKLLARGTLKTYERASARACARRTPTSVNPDLLAFVRS